MTSAAEFQAKVTKAGTNMDRFDQIVNGNATTEVLTDNGNVPSMAKFQADQVAAFGTTADNLAASEAAAATAIAKAAQADADAIATGADRTAVASDKTAAHTSEVNAAASESAAAASAAVAVAAASGTTPVPIDVFTGIGSLTVPSGTRILRSTGYTTRGSGGAVYVSDSTADATLATNHPRFCKADSAGHYFRLIGDFISVEQGGATGSGNDQPAIQAAVNYACAVGIREVRLMTTHESWQPTFPGGSPDGMLGHHLIVPGNVNIVGPEGGCTITLKGQGGVARTKTDGTNTWRSGWLAYMGTAVTRSVLRRIKVDGQITFSNVLSNAESNIYDKGILINDAGSLAPNMAWVDHRDVELMSFGGEIWYMGGSYSATNVYVENLKLHNSPQSSWNPGTMSKVVAVNLEAGDSYQPCEILGGQGHTYIGGRFYNGASLSVTGLSVLTGGYPYWWPVRDTSTVPPFIHFLGTRFEKVTGLNFSSWIRGSIVTIDASVQLSLLNIRDVYLDIEAWCDRNNGSNAITLSGPATTTTQVSGAPVPTYYTLPKNIQVRVKANRTDNAKTNNWVMDGVVFNNGLFDAATCQFHVEGCVRWAWSINGTPVTGYAVPLVTTSDIVEASQPFGGTYDSFAPGARSYDVASRSYSLQPNASGTSTVSLTNTYGYRRGQRVTFMHWQNNTGRPIVFPASGSGMALKEDRTLNGYGDLIELEWSPEISKWTEVRYHTGTKMRFTGSATYDAPSIAAAGTTTTTVTVTGAVLGDYVDRISLGLSAAGLVVTGYVSSSNTVTVVLFNPTAGAIDLASTTLSVEVQKKV